MSDVSDGMIWLVYLAGWLDDIGLPQYKDQFHEGRVDGRMLQYLTVVNTSIWISPFIRLLVFNFTQRRRSDVALLSSERPADS